MSITILGPQRPQANLPRILAELGVRGPVALISAGWRYDEDRDEPLRAELGMTVHNLRLYDAYSEIEREAPDLTRAHARKQAELIRVKASYRLALASTTTALRTLWAERRDPTCPFFTATLDHLRALDQRFLAETRRIHEPFETDTRPRAHPMVRAVRARVRDVLDGCQCVLLAGGHVGILRNRLAFFGMDEALRGRDLVAWSAGAMVLAERVFLFHDHTPGELQPPELLDHGLGLVTGAVFLPHARVRLSLQDADNTALLAQRLAPDRAVALEPGAALTGDLKSWGDPAAGGTLGTDGRVYPLDATEVPRGLGA